MKPTTINFNSYTLLFYCFIVGGTLLTLHLLCGHISAWSDAAEKFTPAQEQQPVCPDSGHRP